MDSEELKEGAFVSIIVIFVLFIGIVSLFGLMAIYAKYNLWSSALSGEAELKRAEWNRQITVREAQAKMDSASMLSQAEVIRAEGVAKANKIIGDSLKGNEGYLRYLWIDSLTHTSDKIIYIPTEAGLPLLEARDKKY